MKIVLCMATKQNPVNTLPLELPNIRPDLVCVAITGTMEEQGSELISQIQALGIRTERLDVPNENSLRALLQLFEDWLESRIDYEIYVNLTGGTKLMSLAAYQVFSSYGFRCFYQILKNNQTLQSNQIIWLDDESVVSGIGEKISLERYLASYQFKITQRERVQEIPEVHIQYAEEIFKRLKTNYESCSRTMTKLNGICAEKINASDRENFIKNLTTDESGFIDHLAHETGLFTLFADKIEYANNDDSIRKLIAGGWLEVLTTIKIREATQTRDLSMNVSFEKSTKRVGTASRNELDVMAMVGAALYIVECKTVNWEGRTPIKPEDSIYKLSALSDIGGLNTKSAFVSLVEISETAKTRAAENNIELICGKSIIELPSRLRRWISAE